MKLHERIAARYQQKQMGGTSRTAGEVKFVKEWEQAGQLKRNFEGNFEVNPKAIQPLAGALWSMSMSMGHLHTAYRLFSKLKSATISPDGLMGGRGYIQSIKEMRKRVSESLENLSDVTDTIFDEIRAPHWEEEVKVLPDREQRKYRSLIEEAEKVMDSPESVSDVVEDSDVADDVEAEAKSESDTDGEAIANADKDRPPEMPDLPPEPTKASSHRVVGSSWWKYKSGKGTSYFDLSLGETPREGIFQVKVLHFDGDTPVTDRMVDSVRKAVKALPRSNADRMESVFVRVFDAFRRSGWKVGYVKGKLRLRLVPPSGDTVASRIASRKFRETTSQ